MMARDHSWSLHHLAAVHNNGRPKARPSRPSIDNVLNKGACKGRRPSGCINALAAIARRACVVVDVLVIFRQVRVVVAASTAGSCSPKAAELKARQAAKQKDGQHRKR